MKCKMKSAKYKFISGFTLIELLVVISIIAVLMSILLPSLRKAREHAKNVVCRTQLHQVALAMMVYNEDYGTVPLCANTVTGESWHNLLKDNQAYLPLEILFCPSRKNDGQHAAGHYAMNYYIGGQFYGNTSKNNVKPMKFGNVKRADRLILLGDIRESCGYATFSAWGEFKNRHAERHNSKGTSLDKNAVLRPPYPSYKSGGGANYIRADMSTFYEKDWEKLNDVKCWRP